MLPRTEVESLALETAELPGQCSGWHGGGLTSSHQALASSSATRGRGRSRRKAEMGRVKILSGPDKGGFIGWVWGASWRQGDRNVGLRPPALRRFIWGLKLDSPGPPMFWEVLAALTLGHP